MDGTRLDGGHDVPAACAASRQLGEHLRRRPRVGERRRADLHRRRAGEQQLGGVPAAGDAADTDDRQVRVGGVDVVHGAHGDRVDRPARQAAAAGAERRSRASPGRRPGRAAC